NVDETAESGLSSQNISVLEVGANARAFAPFLEFIGVRTLVITDIDTTKAVVSEKTEKLSYPACPVAKSSHTSNETLKHFLSAPDLKEEKEFSEWHRCLIEGTVTSDKGQIKLAYQLKEDGYHARSFEDAFISINLEKVKARKDTLAGLKNRDMLDKFSGNEFYSLTDQILGKKSEFAGSVLYSALVEGESWRVPKYIMDGLKWIHKN
ncbi:MAG: TOPRIM nucleotidyl transferase/hydrolase domain-containing protein, partial [Paracoccaceae bacterium]